MSYETCQICQEGILTEADPFVYQHRPQKEYYAHLHCQVKEVVAAEREICACVAEKVYAPSKTNGFKVCGEIIASAIRHRGSL